MQNRWVESRIQESVQIESHFDNWDNAQPISVKPLPQSLKKNQANGQAASR